MRQYARKILVALSLLGLAGCAERPVDVSGKVTWNGAPVNKPGGKIGFVGEQGGTVLADIAEDGTYHAPGVAPGLNRVVVYYANPAAKGGKPFPKKGQPPSTAPIPPPFLTPDKYATAETSGLTADVHDGSATFNFNLEGQANHPESPAVP